MIDAGLIAAMYYHAITCSSTLPKEKGADFKVCAFLNILREWISAFEWSHFFQLLVYHVILHR